MVKKCGPTQGRDLQFGNKVRGPTSTKSTEVLTSGGEKEESGREMGTRSANRKKGGGVGEITKTSSIWVAIATLDRREKA